ncbi:hypothetical protein MUK42_19273 [Musa troglodytarum]|uniref:Uncharacterized protein n=1 Tax=Musa troglodytarum TaxID=320322 RepID=A0A9E7FB43_9LILI|nr:hypothetical protein MUK42_19273 [Musa troglodytarum]
MARFGAVIGIVDNGSECTVAFAENIVLSASLGRTLEILEAREKAKQHIWTFRTVEEASVNWWMMYGHIFKLPPKPDP